VTGTPWQRVVVQSVTPGSPIVRVDQVEAVSRAGAGTGARTDLRWSAAGFTWRPPDRGLSATAEFFDELSSREPISLALNTVDLIRAMRDGGSGTD